MAMHTSKKSEPLIINTDGSSFRNGKSEAVAGVGIFFGTQDPRYVLPPLQVVKA